MPDQRRPSQPGRGPRKSGERRPSAPLTGPITVDEETANALALFNARLVALAEQDKTERRVQKAAKTKDDAAARVRSLEADTKATAEQRAEAATAYRAAVDAWDRARTGAPEPAAAEEAATDDPATEDTVGEDAATDEAATDGAATDDTAGEDAPGASDSADAPAESAATDN